MNIPSVSLIVIAASFFSGCAAVHPVATILSVTAGTLFDAKAEKPSGGISVSQMLDQARNGKVGPVPEISRRLSLSVTAGRLDTAQMDRVTDFANQLSGSSVREVQILAGSAGGLKDAFNSFQRGRDVAQILERRGVTARVVMDPNRAPGRIEIVAAATARKDDA